MRRREFITMLGGAAAARPLIAAGQQQTGQLRRLGVILDGGPYYAGVDGLREGLKATGLEEGQQVTLLVRDTGGDVKAVGAAARALEREERADAIVTIATSVTLAAKRSTANIPIVFAVGSDPVTFGLVDSIARPGGRLTGVHFLSQDLTAKRLEILQEMMPSLRRVVTFYNPENPMAVSGVALAQNAARQLGLELLTREVNSTEAIRERLDTLSTSNADAYFFVADATVTSQDSLVVERANKTGMATMAAFVEPVRVGALAAYGVSYRELGRRAARYVARILTGARPGDLPVEAISVPMLAINIATAKRLGLTIPPSILLRANEVIE